MSDPIEIVFSFDTTGSMYPCLNEVRSQLESTVVALFDEVPNLRIGITAHGDYCDRNSTYVTKHLPLTNDVKSLVKFVQGAGRTGGGDAPECYELVLNEAQKYNWSTDSKKLLVLIGDEVPHPPAHNPGRLDWREETRKLTKMGVLVHGVQCLNRKHATPFYRDLAEMTGGVHIPLAQFNDSVEMFKAIVYQQESPEALQKYEETLVAKKGLTRSLETIFTALSRRDPKTGRFRKVEKCADAGRFQVVRIDVDQPIKDLVESIGAEFQPGRGYYEFKKRERIQSYKKIILMNNETGDMYEDEAAREVLGLPADENIRITPDFDKVWTVFVQSTSYNRKLRAGSRFLYEVE